MADSAVGLLNDKGKQDNKFSIGEVFSTSFSVASYDFPVFFLMTMAAGLLVLVTGFLFPILNLVKAWSGYAQMNSNSYWYYSMLMSSATFITEAIFYPVVSLYITRRLLTRLRPVQSSMKLELQWRHFFLAIGIGVLLTVIHFLCYGYFLSIVTVVQNYFSGSPIFAIRFLYVLVSGLSSFFVLSIFALAFVLLVPISIAENVEFSSLFQRANALISGRHGKIFTIMLLASAITFVSLHLVLSFGLITILPNVMLRYGIVGIIRYPIQSLFYAYLFMLPAVIYHHLRLEELSRDGG